MPVVLTEQSGAVLRLTLNRPQVRNAFDEEVIKALTAVAREAAANPTLRAIVIAGNGPSFCAGADLAWMAKAILYSREENRRDAEDLARLLELLDTLPVPLIARVHGAALGGGVGLVAVSDVAIAADDAMFGFTETKLGILPAVISPFVLPKIGPSAARELFLTGTRFSAARAREIGLVHEIVGGNELDAAVERHVAECLTASPSSIAAAKQLIPMVWGRSPADATRLTADAIAKQRVSPEGQDGLRAFLGKRPPRWVPGA